VATDAAARSVAIQPQAGSGRFVGADSAAPQNLGAERVDLASQAVSRAGLAFS
jgi:hypothetical protein